MSEIVIIFGSITGVFVLLLFVQAFSKLKFCAICASVLLTWTLFLILYYLGYFENLILLSVLIGGSAVGIFSLVKKKIKEQLNIFLLPFLLTLFFIAFVLLGVGSILEPIIFLAALWILFILIYLSRRNPKMKKIVEKVISCCKNF